MHINVVILPKFVILAGLSVWLGIAAFNNVVDASTNVKNLEETLTMSLLVDDPLTGKGLESRAWTKGAGGGLLRGVASFQALVSALLAVAAIAFLLGSLNYVRGGTAVDIADIALSAFALIWIFFLCGGLWFGYWIKQGAIQGVHLSMLLVSIAALIFINDASPKGDPAVSVASVEAGQ